jgi:putative NADH-flavin reductase
MKVLVAGATGATGRLVVEQLLKRGISVRAIVRSAQKLQKLSESYDQLEIVSASISEMSQDDLLKNVKGCDAVISCLGHNLTLKGIYGKPRRLATLSVKRLTDAILALDRQKTTKFILMNTTANRNRDADEKIGFGHALVVRMLRIILPPQADNEQAADYLRTEIRQENRGMEWIAVRPDTLIDEDDVTSYTLHPSPIRDPVFNAGKTSRINVAHCMAELLTDNELWAHWRGQMPVIYNVED